MSGKPGTTRSGIPVAEVYGESERLGRPGEYPFARGIQKDMYRGRLWTMRQYAGFATAKESNRRYRMLLEQGTMGLSVAFDLPTQLGLDPDHPRSKGEVGRVGVSLATVDEMKTLFAGIPFAKVSTSMTINATAGILLAFYVVAAEEAGVPASELRGTVQGDVLKEYVARGNYIYPPAASLRLATDLIDWCARHAPKWNPISISGYHIREAGANAVQELAFTFANAIAYVQAVVASGIPVDEFAGRLSFFFNVHSDFFEEIAKFRAARRIWAKIMRERFGAREPRSCVLRFHSQTAGSTLTAQQAENNVVRVAYQAMAAALGGTQSLHTNSKDEALGLPTEAAAVTALRTQQILAYETGIGRVVDPLGGSWYLESLTDEIERRVEGLLAEVERRGGTVACIEAGFIQGEILSTAYADQCAIDAGEIGIVGVNLFRSEESARPPLHRISAAAERTAASRVRESRRARAQTTTKQALAALRAAARGGENTQVGILQAARARATLGEISDTLREVFGEYEPSGGL